MTSKLNKSSLEQRYWAIFDKHKIKSLFKLFGEIALKFHKRPVLVGFLYTQESKVTSLNFISTFRKGKGSVVYSIINLILACNLSINFRKYTILSVSVKIAQMSSMHML